MMAFIRVLLVKVLLFFVFACVSASVSFSTVAAQVNMIVEQAPPYVEKSRQDHFRVPR